MADKVKDYLGNEFNSEVEMCEYHGILVSTYRKRKRLKWSLRDNLETKENSKAITCKDHLGNEFRSMASMANHYKINRDTLDARLRKGMDLKTALTKQVDINKRRSKSCIDHIGNKFTSTDDMCKHYKVDVNLFKQRVNSGWSLERALTEKVNKNKTKQPCKDHLGNNFESTADMCNKYGIDSNVVTNRLRIGWSLERALTEKVNKRK